MAEISAELTLKVAGLQQGLEKARAELQTFRSSMAAQGRGIGVTLGESIKGGLGNVAAFIGLPLGIGALVTAARATAQHFDQIGDSAAALNASNEGIQRLEHIAAMTSTPLETMVNGLMRVKRALFEVDNEAKQKALANIGLDAQAFMGMDADRAFIALAKAYQEAQSSGKGFADVMALIKGASPDLFGAITTDADALERFSQHAVASDAAIRNFTESLGRAKVMGIDFTNSVANDVSDLSNVLDGLAKGFVSWSLGSGFRKGYEMPWQMDKEDSQREEAARKMRMEAEKKEATDRREAAARDKAAREQAARLKQEHDELRGREGVNSEQQSVRIAELRATGHKTEADKLERLQKGQREFQRLRDAHPEMGEQWALDMAHRKDAAENMKPGRIHGYTGKAPAPHAGLDWLYGHNRDKGGRELNKEFKFPALDDMNRTLKNIDKKLEEK